MAVNSKADKRHQHTVSRVQTSIRGGAALRPTSYSLAQPANQASAGNSGPGGQISQAGTKALQLRAKAELRPLSDPTQSIVE